MTISVLFLVGRFLLAVPFVLLGIDRMVSAEARPAQRWWGLVALAGAAGVILGAWGDVAALVLAAAVVGGGTTGLRGPESDDEARLLLIGLFGAAIVTAALYIAVGAALDLTLTGPVFDLDLR